MRNVKSDSDYLYWQLLPVFVHRTFSLFVYIIFFSQSVLASVKSEGIKNSQQPIREQNAVSPDKQQDYARAKQLFQESQLLYRKATIESRKLAIEKSEQALKIWQKLEEKEEEAETLNFIGLLYTLNRENKKALTFFEQALDIWREKKNRLKQAETLFVIGSVYSYSDEQEMALKYLQEALLLYKAENQFTKQGQTWYLIGTVYTKLSKTQQALDSLNEALDIQLAQNDLPRQVTTLGAIGSIYTILGEPEKALTTYNQALEIQRKRGDLLGQADILTQIGNLQVSLGKNQTAVETFNTALNLRQIAQQDRTEKDILFSIINQSLILTNLAHAHSYLGNYQQALEYGEQARKLMQKVGDPSKEARVLYVISTIYYLKGDYKKQLAILEEALELQRSVNDQSGQIDTFNDIAGRYQSFGDYQQALNYHNQALELARQIKSPAQEAETLSKIAGIYRDLAEYNSSVNYFDQAQEIYGKIGDKYKQAQTLDAIAGVWHTSQDYPKALEKYQQALQLWRQQQIPFGQLVSLLGTVRTYESLENYPKALDTANRALSLSSELKNNFVKATTLTLIGRIYQGKKDYQNALSSLKQAVSIAKQMENKQIEANALRNIGKTFYKERKYQEAIATFNQELELRQALNDKVNEAEVMFEIAAIQKAIGKQDIALKQIENTIQTTENLRAKIVSPELRTSYFATKQKYYQFKIDLLMQLHKQNPSKGYDAQALETSERARARSLVELLKEANANIREGIKPELLARERNLQQKFDALEKQRLELASRPNTEKQIAGIKQQIDQLLDDYQQLRTEIRLNSQRYADLKFPEPVTLQEIQQKMLDDDTLLLTYSLGEEHSYLWVVSTTKINSYELPKLAEIEAQAKQFYGYLKSNPKKFSAPAATNIGKQSATKLSQMLLQPVVNKLGNKRLLIVADGALQYIPFTALSVCKDVTCNASIPLLVNHEIINSPSISTIAILRSEQQRKSIPKKTLAVLADPVFSRDDKRFISKDKQNTSSRKVNSDTQNENPDNLLLQRSARESDITFNPLPFTRQEANGILALAPQSSIKAFDFDANRAFAMNPQLSQYRFVHFATHGILNSINPELSGVVLSLVNQKGEVENGFLRLNDIFNLKLPAELVVLSACETGLGKEVRGEGLVGLTRGFMYAGSPRLIVSLWKVADEGTSILMTKFYTKMLQENLKPAEALRVAQLEMLQSEKYSAPYYWAGFTLQGEWR
ncbi:tetratricopeptide repeat protein [Nostoc sp. FACHB-87]|uniref:CHAT domain-containing tetratricopeptide repeat protein n=1 Tax=Nostocaceae TaxID=1162 RepID=UPI001689ED90|nr:MULTISPECIES: tetratricopeptide repeat protein [Nostocaceae]MBD2458861.1 tetratricopeptide repeat protein [Nostoc sp. FACHB-87]MBD2479898.1 tetratricopeptide repeat protein [Anabaena sp. FACHB-83]